MSSKSSSKQYCRYRRRSPVTHHHDIYPSIDPEPLYAAKSYSGKVVLVTGASRGVGRATRAGASLAILARSGDALEETKDLIVAAVPGADVLVLAADVCDVEAVRGAVQSVLRRFGKLDILIANAGGHRIYANKDPNAWRNTFEVNIRGSFNFISATAPASEKTHGYNVIISSSGAQLRFPGASEACISKFAMNRLVEFIVLVEAIPVYADGGNNVGAPDAVALPAATMLYLTSGRADWLSGRFVPWYCSENWDMAEVERDWKDMVIQKGGLLNKCILYPSLLTTGLCVIIFAPLEGIF